MSIFSEQLRIKKVKEEQKVIQTFSENQLQAVIDFKPKTFAERRLHSLLLLLIDTGIRIDEALTLKRENVDLFTYSFSLDAVWPVSHQEPV